MKSRVQNSYFTRIISIIQEFGCFYERLYGIIFKQKEKNVKKVAFRGPRGIVAGTGAGTGRQIIFPGEWGAEKRPGTSGNGFPGFPVASLNIMVGSILNEKQNSDHI